MSKNTVSSKQSSKKRRGTGEKHFSPPSTPDCKRKDIQVDGKTSENEVSDSDEIIAKSAENKNPSDIGDTTSKKKLVKSGEDHGEYEEGLFPGRRRSYHRMGNTEESVSLQEDVNLSLVAKKDEGTQKKKILESYGSTTTEPVLWYINIYILFFIVFLICAVVFMRGSNSETKTITIDIMKEKFPKQEDILWRAITSGLNDTLKFEHPSSYILIHEREADNTVKTLIRELSQYAVCHLSDCNNIPIKLNNEVLNSVEFVNNSDYGVIITRFKRDLENIGVMVIENLDEIPEKYALAFHSFCDQISPLVKKSAFFFSMKIDKLEKSSKYDIRTVEKILRGKWKDMESDIFSPLFARIAEMPIRIQPE